MSESRLSLSRLKRLCLGAPLDPLSPKVRQHIALAAFLAWVGLGADGLSSANYGPEEAFLALGEHTHLALYLAAATAVTVFIIAFSYNQVISLFPNGGGGYKVATELIGPHAGLLSGSALIIDYVLTIAISVASGTDAVFSLLPPQWQIWKLPVEFLAVILLTGLNLRGMKEPIALLVPLFLGFLITHAFLIIAGIVAHAEALPSLIPATIEDTQGFSAEVGMLGVIAVLLRAFAMGGGTYTGIEAVSNNVNMLREPRVRTGRWTMVYMAMSLAFTAAGLIVLYLLWDVAKQEGRTLNATVFAAVLGELFGTGSNIAVFALGATLVFAAALLFVAANTGFLGGPSVLANMAADRWMPHQFTQLSDRLVTQNGILVMGAAAMAALWVTGGAVHFLVVLYSINVFLTFSLCLAGLCRYWLTHRGERGWGYRLIQSLVGFIVTFGILLVTLVEKFADGAWFTVVATGFVVLLGLAIKRHYDGVNRQLAEADVLFASQQLPPAPAIAPDPQARTAALFVGTRDGAAMHTLLAALTLFPGQFRNVVLISVGEIDTEQFHGEEKLKSMQADIGRRQERFAGWCARRGFATDSFTAYGTETVKLLDGLAAQVVQKYPNTVFFASKLLFRRDNMLTRMLHNGTALALQRLLHMRGMPMVILPMKV